MRMHNGTLMAGIVYTGIGMAFLLEAMGYWTMQIADLRLIGPLALLAIGLSVIVGSLNRREAPVRRESGNPGWTLKGDNS